MLRTRLALLLAAIVIGLVGPRPAVVRAADDEKIAAGATSSLPKQDPKLAGFIAPDFCAAVVLHPSRLMKSPVLAPLPTVDQLPPLPPGPGGIDTGKLAKQLDPRKIRRIVVLVDPFPGGNVAFFPGAIIQFEEPTDGAALFRQVFPDAADAEFQGQSYSTSATAAMAKAPLACCVAGPRTVLLAPEPTLRKMLKSAGTARPLAEQLRHADLENDVLAEVLVERVVAALERQTGLKLDEMPDKDTPKELKMVLQSVDSASLSLNLSGDTLLRATIVAKNEAAAGQLHAMLGMFQGMLKEQHAAAAAEPPKDVPPQIGKPMIDLGGQILDGMSVAKEGNRIVLTIKMPPALGELSKNAGAMLQGGAK